MIRAVSLATILGLSVVLATATPSAAAKNLGGFGASTATSAACIAARNFCVAACNINDPDDGTFGGGLNNSLCQRECDEALKRCTDSDNGFALRQTVRKLNSNPLQFGQ